MVIQVRMVITTGWGSGTVIRRSTMETSGMLENLNRF